MCGRYKISTKAAQIVDAFDVDVEIDASATPYEPKERFNVAPTDPAPCIRVDDHGKRRLLPMRWGLVPFWAKDVKFGARMINARIETVEEKKWLEEALEKRRCLVVSDGFYEWLKKDTSKPKEKQPHLLCFADRHVFAFAGLWARWRPKEEGDVVESFTILTTPPNALAARVHDRMPLIFDPRVDKERIAAWLDPTKRHIDLAPLKEPRELDGFTLFPVDKRVGNVRNDDPSLAVPLD